MHSECFSERGVYILPPPIIILSSRGPDLLRVRVYLCKLESRGVENIMTLKVRPTRREDCVVYSVAMVTSSSRFRQEENSM